METFKDLVSVIVIWIGVVFFVALNLIMALAPPALCVYVLYKLING